MEDLNQIVRKAIIKRSDEDRLFVIWEHLEEMPKEEQVLYTAIEMVSFMDLFKQIRYHMVTHSLSKFEIKVLPQIERIIVFSDIQKEILNNPELFGMMLDASRRFHESSALEKLGEIKSMSLGDRNFLTEICPSFQDELNKLDIPVTLNWYFNYLKKITSYYEKEGCTDLELTFIVEISYFLKNLFLWDRKNAVENILDLSLIDYLCSKKYNEETYPDIANGYKKAMKRRNLFEHSKEEEIIQHALNDEYYLPELLDCFIHERKAYQSEEEFEKALETLKEKDEQK